MPKDTPGELRRKLAEVTRERNHLRHALTCANNDFLEVYRATARRIDWYVVANSMRLRAQAGLLGTEVDPFGGT